MKLERARLSSVPLKITMMLQTRSIEISKKIDDLMYEREITAMMKLTEKSLSGFFEDEKDIYKNNGFEG